jgi:hypothetical protein
VDPSKTELVSDQGKMTNMKKTKKSICLLPFKIGLQENFLVSICPPASFLPTLSFKKIQPEWP